jgi:cell division initiation protein
MAQVDEFLDILTADYSALYSENAVLKSKMKVLVDKVEEYRSTEEAMRKALMTAQRMADDLVREAQQKKEEILRNAEQEAHHRMEQLAQELEAEQFRLAQAKQATATFVEKARALQARQEEFLNQLDELAPQPPKASVPDAVEEAVSEIDDNVQRLLAQAMMEATAENLKARNAQQQEEDLDDTAEFDVLTQQAEPLEQDEPPLAAKTSRIDFGQLQFGQDYEIK